MKGYYKIPFRQVYCEGIRVWIAELILIFVVYKLNPPHIPPLGS
jgi:hypothetical protein